MTDSPIDIFIDRWKNASGIHSGPDQTPKERKELLLPVSEWVEKNVSLLPQNIGGAVYLLEGMAGSAVPEVGHDRLQNHRSGRFEKHIEMVRTYYEGLREEFEGEA